MSLIQRISYFVPIAFCLVFFTFYITAAPISPTQRSGLWHFRCCRNKDLNKTSKVSKHFTFYEKILHCNNYSLCRIIFLALLQWFWPLCRWPVFQSCWDPSASPEHHFSSYVPLLTFCFPKSTWGKKAVPRDCIWEEMYHRGSFGQPKNMLSPKVHCRQVTGIKPLFISEEKAWFLTGINQESSVTLHWSALELAQVTVTCAEQNHFITENQI